MMENPSSGSSFSMQRTVALLASWKSSVVEAKKHSILFFERTLNP
jgi:hypothetical protein